MHCTRAKVPPSRYQASLLRIVVVGLQRFISAFSRGSHNPPCLAALFLPDCVLSLLCRTPITY